MMHKVSLATVDTVPDVTAMIPDFKVVGVLGHVSFYAFAKWPRLLRLRTLALHLICAWCRYL